MYQAFILTSQILASKKLLPVKFNDALMRKFVIDKNDENEFKEASIFEERDVVRSAIRTRTHAKVQ